MESGNGHHDWTLVPHNDGLASLNWQGPHDAVDLERLELWVSLWHPHLLVLDRVTIDGGCIALHTRRLRQRSPHGLTRGADDVAAVLTARFETPVDACELTHFARAGSGDAFAPPPRLWLKGSDPRDATATGSAAASPPHFGLVHGGREPLRALASQALDALCAGAGSHAIVFTGPDGAGKSALLDQIAFDAAIRGLVVRRELPGAMELEPGSGPLVLVLDDLERGAPDGLARARALAERSRRGVLIFGTAAETPRAPLGLKIDVVALAPLTPETLVAAVVPPSLEPERAARAAVASGGSPLAFRLWLGHASAGARGDVAEAAVATLTTSARLVLAIVALAGEEEPEVIRDAAGDAQAALGGGALTGLLEERNGRLRPVSRGVAAAALTASPVTALVLADRLAAALAKRPGREFACALHLLRAGHSAEAAEAARRGGLAAEPGALGTLAALEELERAGMDLEAPLLAVKAEELERAGRGGDAVKLLEVLARESPHPAERARHRLRLAETLARKGDLAGARVEVAAMDPTARTEAPDLAARAALLEAHVLYRMGQVREARETYERTLKSPGAKGGELRAEGLAGLGQVLVRAPGGSRRGEKLLAEARVLYGVLGRYDRLSTVLSREGSASARRGDLERALDRHLLALENALASGDASGASECHVDIAAVSHDKGDLRRAERHLREAAAGFEVLGDTRALTLARANLAAIAVELGRPGEAEPVLLEALAADTAAAQPWNQAHDWRFLGAAALARGELDLARERLDRARTIFRELGDESGEGEACLGLAHAALDAREPAAAARHAESGLRALAPHPGGSLADRLRLAAARGHLECGVCNGEERAVEEAVKRGDASRDPSVRAEAAAVDALRTSRVGPVAAAVARFERAIEAAESQDRADVLGRVLGSALEQVGEALEPRRLAALVRRLRDLHQAPDRSGRLRLAGLPAILEASEPRPPGRLGDDGLVRLEEALGSTAPLNLDAVLEVLRQRLPFLRAALLATEGGGTLAVKAAARAVPAAADRPEAMRIALVLGERARLTHTAVVVARLGDEPALAGHAETQGWDLGPALAVAARDGTVLYLDRPRAEPAFAAEEVRFARAFVERVALELVRIPAGTARTLVAGDGADDDDLGLLGASPAAVKLRHDLRTLAAFDIPVFLAGESGTGKELAARALHRLSRRALKPFVALNCAAVPETLLDAEFFGVVRGAYSGAQADREGLLARADGGVLFLDEVAELSPAFQAKLLRAVELGELRPVGSSTARTVDVRFVCATNRDMDLAVREGRFREDLYYRLLATATVRLPPLRERHGDVALLIAHFVAREALKNATLPMVLAPEALAALERHAFPGNVRELERLVAGLNARAGGRTLAIEDLPPAMAGLTAKPEASLIEARAGFERAYLTRLLERHGGNRTHAARTAGVARQTLIQLLKRHRLDGDRETRVLPERPGPVFRVSGATPMDYA